MGRGFLRSAPNVGDKRMIKMAEVMSKVKYSCPFCDEEHVISVIKKVTKALVDNTPVEYEETYYYCSFEDDKFVSKEMLSKSLLAAKDGFRML